jgi:hypothetical protein
VSHGAVALPRKSDSRVQFIATFGSVLGVFFVTAIILIRKPPSWLLELASVS